MGLGVEHYVSATVTRSERWGNYQAKIATTGDDLVAGDIVIGPRGEGNVDPDDTYHDATAWKVDDAVSGQGVTIALVRPICQGMSLLERAWKWLTGYPEIELPEEGRYLVVYSNDDLEGRGMRLVEVDACRA